MRILFTHILTESLILKYKLSFAACNFSFNLISSGGFDKVYSTMGTYVGGDMDKQAYFDSRYELIYIQFLRKKGRVGRLFANLCEQMFIFFKIPRGAKLWLYNISTLNVFLYILLRLFKRSVQINVIELDFTPPTKTICISTFFLFLMNKAHSVIKLADSPLFTNLNSVCLAGVVSKDSIQEPKIEIPKMDFLLSGVLHPDISSIPIILDAFAKVPECTLHITGKFDNIALMNSYTSKYPNIIYHGILAYNEYLDLLHSVTFQMSLRNPVWKDNTCNFPSKIIEALLHNRIVISTIHYKQINDFLYIKTERSIDGFVFTLRELSRLPSNELMKYANQGHKTIKLFSADIWLEWIVKLENNL